MPEVIVAADIAVHGASPALGKALQAACSHANPDYGKLRAMGRWTGGTPTRIRTWSLDAAGVLRLPRGAMGRLREAARELGEPLRIRDARISAPIPWPPFDPNPGGPKVVRAYQAGAEEACVRREQGLVRAPTGSGKTHIAFSTLSRIGQRTLVIVRDRKLLEQWVDKARHHLGMKPGDYGIVRGGRKHVTGRQLTLALQQTLWAKGFPLQDFARQFGAVAVDEVHGTAAQTVSITVGAFPARYRLGFSADETRKDRKEFLVYDLFGDVIYEVTRSQVEADGFTVPVVVRLVPTDFEAEWFTSAPVEERDFKRLVDEIICCPRRDHRIRTVLHELCASHLVPALVFTHRREHAERLVEGVSAALRVGCGLMMGGERSSETFDETLAALRRGTIPIAVGTFQSIGQGIDLPSVLAGVVATPIGANRQYFNQVRGRICRPAPRKKVGYLYYLWDRNVFPRVPENLLEWNDGRVEIYDGGDWVRADERGDAA
jgi:superfamily II DNA or RNA helicase